jgi:hypothetical protein
MQFVVGFPFCVFFITSRMRGPPTLWFWSAKSGAPFGERRRRAKSDVCVRPLECLPDANQHINKTFSVCEQHCVRSR